MFYIYCIFDCLNFGMILNDEKYVFFINVMLDEIGE